MLIAVYVVSLPVFSTLTYVILILKQNAVKAAYNLRGLRLTTMQAIKHYVRRRTETDILQRAAGKIHLTKHSGISKVKLRESPMSYLSERV